jgi:hypothetical protein
MTANEPELRERLRALAEMVPVMEAADFSFGRWEGGERTASGAIQMPYVELDAGGEAFRAAVGRGGWVTAGFDWSAWTRTPEFEALRSEPEAIEQATAEQIERLLTTLVRADRFSEGTLLAAWESGLLLRVVKRARGLLEEVEGGL